MKWKTRQLGQFEALEQRNLLSITAPQLVADINVSSASSDPSEFVQLGDQTIFVADDGGPHGRELWITDGTNDGTRLLKDILPGTESSDPADLTPMGDAVFFTAETDSESRGRELWRTNGTEATTIKIKDGEGFGDYRNGVRNLTPVGDLLYYSVHTWFYVPMVEIWRSDGTEAGTEMVTRLKQGWYRTNTESLTAVGDQLYYVADSEAPGGNGDELWVTDGTDDGTYLVKDINPGADTSSPMDLTAVGDTLYFTADDGTNGRELWKSDGTEAGTQMIMDVWQGVGSSTPTELTAIGNTVYFTATDGTSGREPWKSGGSEPGTQMVKDILPGSNSGFPRHLTSVGNTLYFTATGDSSGTELWESDGTETGTQIVADLYSGAASSSPSELTAVGDTLYFTASDETHGAELWKTKPGTQLVMDIYPGGDSSNPELLTNVGGTLYFRATDGSHGTEPWVLEQSEPSDFFHTEGRFIVDSTGTKTVFRGVNVPGLESGVFDVNFSTNPYPGELGSDYYPPREEDIEAIHNLGFNVLRVPIEWARLVTAWTPGMPVELDAAYLNAMDQVVEMAARHDQKVIWKFHSYCKYWSGQKQYVLIAHNPDYQDLLATTWRHVAAHYASNETVLGYDLMNEPQTEEGASEGWHGIAQSVVNVIREVDTNHLVFVEGPDYSHSGDWPTHNREPFIVDTITPSRAVYTPHVYFAYNNNKYTGPGEEIGPIGGWEYVVRDRLMPAIDWSLEYEVPILIGETGGPCTAEWAGVLNNAFNEYWEPLGISVLTWHYSDPAKRLDNLNLALYPESGMLDVLADYPGGTYEQTGDFSPSLADSPMYGDARTNPWHIGEGFWGPVNVNYSNAEPVRTGDYSLSCQFDEGWGGLKFVHQNGISTSRFDVLQFWLYPTSDTLDFRLFTAGPDFGDDGSLVVEGYQDYPAYADRPSLGDYVSLVLNEWNLVRIPLEDIVSPTEDIITGIAMQNGGSSQAVFFLDDISLLPLAQGLTVAPNALSVAEDSTAQFTVRLDAQPQSNVTVTIDKQVGGDGDLNVQQTNLTFTPSDWYLPKPVTVAAAEDTDAEDGSATFIISSTGLASQTVVATEDDNDMVGITVKPTLGLTTTEAGGQATFTVVLDSQPTADVQIALASSNTDEGTVATVPLTFTPSTWNEAQTVTVTGQDDDLDDGDVAYTILVGPVTSLDTKYASIDPDDVSVTNTDNDKLRIDVELVAVAAASASDEAASLPQALSSVTEGSTFYVEVWAKNTDGSANGITGGYLDFSFDVGLATAGTVAHGGLYTNLTMGSVDNTTGLVDDLGGNANPGVVDKGDDEWVRLAYVSFVADVAGELSFSTAAGGDSFARAAEGEIDSANVEMNVPVTTVTIDPRCIYDVDESGRIGAGDYSYLSVAWMSRPEDAHWDARVDFDESDHVGTGDYSWLSVNWLKFVDDPTIEYPPPSGSSTASNLFAPMTAYATSPSIDVELVAVSAESGLDEAANLPNAISSVNKGDTFFVEVWLKNIDGSINGITGGYLDFSFDVGLATAGTVAHGGLYTNLTMGSVDNTTGLVDDLGGNANPGVVDKGDDEWVRLGYVPFTADGVGTLELTAAAGIDSFARAGEGGIPWPEVEMNSPMTTLAIEEPVPAPVELGKVDFKRLESLNPSREDLWFRVETAHEGWLTVQAVAGATDEELAIRVFEPTNRAVPVAASAVQDGRLRFDYGVEQGQTYLLQVTGTTNDASLLLANLVYEQDGAVTVHGTAEADVFQFAATGSYAVTINGVGYHFDDAVYETIVFNGGLGDDSALLTGGANVEVARFSPDHGTFGENGFLVTVTDVVGITAHGGGGADEAYLYDSVGDDEFVARKGYGKLSGDGFSLETFDFMVTYGYATTGNGGNDVAYMEDTAGADKFKFDWPNSKHFFGKMYGGGEYFNRAKDFERIVATMTDGKDTVRLFDSTGNDTFFGQKAESRLTGPGYDVTVSGYDSLIAYASKGTDIAYLEDSEDDDTTRARSHKVILWGGDDAHPTYEITARMFDEYHFEAKHGGFDRAKFHDTVLNDHVYTGGNSASLYRNEGELDLLYETVAFEWVRLYGTDNDSHDTLEKEDPLDFELIYDPTMWSETT